MAAPVYNPGQVLTAQDCDVWFTGQYGYKPNDQSRASTTTPTNDPDLTVALAATSVYEVRVSLAFACAANGVNFQFQFAVPASSTGWYAKEYWTGATTQQTGFPDPWTQNRIPFIDNTRDWGLTGSGVIITTTAGNLILQWAQGGSSATAVTLRKHSSLIAVRIA